MTNPLQEYNERMGISCVLVIDEGVVMFQNNGHPSILMTVNSPGRSIVTCKKCHTQKEPLIIECIDLTTPPPRYGSLLGHWHVTPDVDLNSLAKGFDVNNEPVFVSDDEEFETRLWFSYAKHHSSHQSLKRFSFKAYDKNQMLDCMWSASLACSPLFEGFIKAVHQRYVVNRRYICKLS